MTSIIRKCSELSTSVKFGMSGTFTGLCYAFGATNPVTLIAMAAIPFLPNLMSRCMQQEALPRLSPPAPVLIRQPQDAIDEKERQRRDMIGPLDTESARLIEELMLEDAIRTSTQHDTKENYIEIALAASLNPIKQVRTCPYAKALNADESAHDAIIPPDLLLEKENGEYFNIATFLLTLLLSGIAPSDPESRDMSGKEINVMDIELAALILGFDSQCFLGIWEKATVPQAAVNRYFLDNPNDNRDIVDVLPDLLRDARIKLFKKLVQDTATPACQAADAFCKKAHGDIWNKR